MGTFIQPDRESIERALRDLGIEPTGELIAEVFACLQTPSAKRARGTPVLRITDGRLHLDCPGRNGMTNRVWIDAAARYSSRGPIS